MIWQYYDEKGRLSPCLSNDRREFLDADLGLEDIDACRSINRMYVIHENGHIPVARLSFDPEFPPLISGNVEDLLSESYGSDSKRRG